MTDIDALLAPARWGPGRCSVEQALEEIADLDKRAQVEAGVANERVPPRGVVAAFRALLAPLPPPTDQSVRRHRARRCSCP